MANPLQRIDLNLLVTLHALLNEQHISRAAVRLHKSQPAVSHWKMCLINSARCWHRRPLMPRLRSACSAW